MEGGGQEVEGFIESHQIDLTGKKEKGRNHISKLPTRALTDSTQGRRHAARYQSQSQEDEASPDSAAHWAPRPPGLVGSN